MIFDLNFSLLRLCSFEIEFPYNFLFLNAKKLQLKFVVTRKQNKKQTMEYDE